MKRLKTLVIEDEPKVREEIEWLVKSQPNLLLLGSCGSVKKAVGLITRTRPDFILFDIQLTDGTSFDILSQLKEIDFKFVFITAYDRYAIKAIKFGAFDYLLKPLDEEEFDTMIEKVVSKSLEDFTKRVNLTHKIFQKKQINIDDIISIPAKDYIQIVKLKDIMYCESCGSYTNLHLHGGDVVLSTKTLKLYDGILPQDYFIRTHQSYIINKYFISRFIKTGSIVLTNNIQIPVSVRKKDDVLNFLSTL